MLTRVDLQLFISSIHRISSDLSAIDVPVDIYTELSAMEAVIQRDLQNQSKS